MASFTRRNPQWEKETSHDDEYHYPTDLSTGILADLFRRQVPGCKHQSGVTLRWCAQMGIPRGEP